MFEIPESCPNCDLALLCGAILDAAQKIEQYGPILGLHKGARPETAKAGYIGLGSLWMYKPGDKFYQCPRCGVDPIAVADRSAKGSRE
ncbi:MAG TPA: hypothetical protein VFI31_08355 [Pirellulales bacterium]|nr:hypothetical protein [Pirellulales bacterium]